MLSCFIDEEASFSITELSPSGGTYTWGTLGANDRIFLALSYTSTNGSPVTITSVTIGGASATIDVNEANTGTNPGGALIAHAAPSGTSGSFSVSSSGSNGSTAHLSVYKVTNFTSVINTNGAQAGYTETSGTVQATVSTVNGGAAIAAETVTGQTASTAEEVATTGANKTFTLSFQNGIDTGTLYIAAASFS